MLRAQDFFREIKVTATERASAQFPPGVCMRSFKHEVEKKGTKQGKKLLKRERERVLTERCSTNSAGIFALVPQTKMWTSTKLQAWNSRKTDRPTDSTDTYVRVYNCGVDRPRDCRPTTYFVRIIYIPFFFEGSILFGVLFTKKWELKRAKNGINPSACNNSVLLLY